MLQIIECSALRSRAGSELLQGLNPASLSNRQTPATIYSLPDFLPILLWAFFPPIKCLSFYFLNHLSIYYFHDMNLNFCIRSHWLFLLQLILKFEALLLRNTSRQSLSWFWTIYYLYNSAIHCTLLFKTIVLISSKVGSPTHSLTYYPNLDTTLEDLKIKMIQQFLN